MSLFEELGEDVAEVTHEALFSRWQRLNDWLDSSREDIRFQRRLKKATSRWEDAGRPYGLLWRSTDIDMLRELK